MTPEQIQETEFFQRHSRFALEVRQHIAASYFRDDVSNACLKCNSPLEAAFAAWWIAAVQTDPDRALLIEQQVPVCLSGAQYRLDFVVSVNPEGLYGSYLTADREPPRIAIELDGHEFHERTKEQVDLRNARDRALQINGWIVIHLSGSEFNRDPFGCVAQVLNDIRRVVHDALQ